MELCSKCNQQRVRNNIAVGSGKYTTQLRRTSRGRTSVGVLGASSEEISGSNLRHAQPFPHSSQIIWIPSSHYLPSLLLHIALKKHVSLALVYKKQPLLLLRNFASSLSLLPLFSPKNRPVPSSPFITGRAEYSWYGHQHLCRPHRVIQWVTAAGPQEFPATLPGDQKVPQSQGPATGTSCAQCKSGPLVAPISDTLQSKRWREVSTPQIALGLLCHLPEDTDGSSKSVCYVRHWGNQISA